MLTFDDGKQLPAAEANGAYGRSRAIKSRGNLDEDSDSTTDTPDEGSSLDDLNTDPFQRYRENKSQFNEPFGSAAARAL